MKNNAKKLVFTALSLALAGCAVPMPGAHQQPAPTVEARQVGTISETVLATVVDVRAVAIKPQQQQKQQIQIFGPSAVPAMEIVLKMDNGKLQTIVQPAGEVLRPGQVVRVTKSASGWYVSAIGGQQQQPAPAAGVGGWFGGLFQKQPEKAAE